MAVAEMGMVREWHDTRGSTPPVVPGAAPALAKAGVSGYNIHTHIYLHILYKDSYMYVCVLYIYIYVCMCTCDEDIYMPIMCSYIYQIIYTYCKYCLQLIY